MKTVAPVMKREEGQLHPEPEWTMQAANLRGIAGMTLYEGGKMRGGPSVTVLHGKVLLNQGKLEQEPGYGRFLRRGSPVPPLAGAVK